MTNQSLLIEIKHQRDETFRAGHVALTPPIDEDYWTYRVRLSESQAIVGFPKFNTIGIGFAQEEDWNTNLPYTCDAEEIYRHIKHNTGDDSISHANCIKAIRLIQAAVIKDRKATHGT